LYLVDTVYILYHISNTLIFPSTASTTKQDRGKELGGNEQSRTEARNLVEMNRAGQRQGTWRI